LQYHPAFFCPTPAFFSFAITIARSVFLLHPVSLSAFSPQALTGNAGAFDAHTHVSVCRVNSHCLSCRRSSPDFLTELRKIFMKMKNSEKYPH